MKNIQRFSILIVALVCLLLPFHSGNAAFNTESLSKNSTATVSKTISKGKSYELLNISKKKSSVKVTGPTSTSYDYVVYDRSGSVVTSQLAEWGYRTITVPSGGKVVITNQSKVVIKAGGPKNSFKGKASSTPALVRYTISKGKSYEFLNTSKQKGPVKVVGPTNTSFDYVIYDKRGTVVTSQLAEWGYRTLTVPSGGKVVITNQSKVAIKAGGPKKLFKGKVSNTPALVRYTISKGKSYEFLNTSKQNGPVKVVGPTNTSFDYVIYDKSGTVVTSQLAEWGYRTLTVPFGGKMVITNQGKVTIKAGAPKNLFKGNASSTPALVRYTISKGKSYEYLNISKQEGPVKVVGPTNTSFDYVVYDKSGTVVTSQLAEWGYRTIMVPSGGKVVLTNQSNVVIKAGGPKKLFKGKVSSTPSLVRFTISKGKSYEFLNTSKQDGPVKVVGPSKTSYGYVVYDGNGTVLSFKLGGWGNRTITVPSGGKVIITNQGNIVIKAGGPQLLFKGRGLVNPLNNNKSITGMK